MDEYTSVSSPLYRIKYTDEQRDLLESVFEETTSIKKDRAEAIALLLNVTPKQIQTWFQNKRAKLRRDRMRKTGHTYALKRPMLPLLDATCSRNSDLMIIAQQAATSASSQSSGHLLPCQASNDTSSVKGFVEQRNAATYNVPRITVDHCDSGLPCNSNLVVSDHYSSGCQNTVPISGQEQNLLHDQWLLLSKVQKEYLNISSPSSDRPFSQSSCSSSTSTISQGNWASPEPSSSISDVSLLEDLMAFQDMQSSPSSFGTEYANLIPDSTGNTGKVQTCSNQDHGVLATMNSNNIGQVMETRFPPDIPVHQNANITANVHAWPVMNRNQSMLLATKCAPVNECIENFGHFAYNLNNDCKENYDLQSEIQPNFPATNPVVPENNCMYVNSSNQQQNYVYSGINHNFQQGYMNSVGNYHPYNR